MKSELTARKFELIQEDCRLGEEAKKQEAEWKALYTSIGKELLEKVFRGEDLAKKREEWQKASSAFADKKDWESYNRMKWEFPDSITARIMKAGLSTEERMLLAKHMHDDLEKLLECGTWEFGHYADESDCSSYQAATRNLENLKLLHFAEYCGQYRKKIPSETIEETLLKALQKRGRGDEITGLQKRISERAKRNEEISGELAETEKALQAYAAVEKFLEKKGIHAEDVEKTMPELIEFMKGKYPSYLTVSLDSRVAVMLREKSWDSKSAGIEYGVRVIVWRDGKTEEKYFKYRDAYSERGDNFNLAFREAEIGKITKTCVSVMLRSSKYSTTQTFNLAETKNPHTEEKTDAEFKKMYASAKQELLRTHTRENGIMPDYVQHLFTEMKTLPMGTTSGRMIPYEKAEIVDECIKGNKAVVILRAQIDHGGGHGRQYEWVAYRVTKEGKEMIARDTLWDLDARHGKRVEMKAEELAIKL